MVTYVIDLRPRAHPQPRCDSGRPGEGDPAGRRLETRWKSGEGGAPLETGGPRPLGAKFAPAQQPNGGSPFPVTGLDIWASLLSTGAICTFYTTVVSTPHPTWGLRAH